MTNLQSNLRGSQCVITEDVKEARRRATARKDLYTHLYGAVGSFPTSESIHSLKSLT